MNPFPFQQPPYSRSYLEDFRLYCRLIKMQEAFGFIMSELSSKLSPIMIDTEKAEYDTKMALINTNFDNLIKVMAEVHEKHISHKDLRDLITFYDAHPKMAAKTMLIAKDVAEATQQWLESMT